jgi:hypothetical protein
MAWTAPETTASAVVMNDPARLERHQDQEQSAQTRSQSHPALSERHPARDITRELVTSK